LTIGRHGGFRHPLTASAHIKVAQAEGQSPPVEPVLFHCMRLSLTATLSEFGPQMWLTCRLSADRPEVADPHWTFVEGMVFRRPRDARVSF